MNEQKIEQELINTLKDLKYTYRPDINDRKSLEDNFREKFENLNRVTLTASEYDRLMDNIITSDVYKAAEILRDTETFYRDDGTPLHYTLVNTKDWCKNTFEVIHQLRMNTKYSHHRYDVILLINGVPVVQIELKTSHITPSRAMQQIIEYKNDEGNGYSKTLMCFLQMFVVSNRNETWYFANNNSKHFSFHADERFLPLYQFANPDNSKVGFLEEFAKKFLAKCTLGQMISRYMVLVASEKKIMMMRPYQIYAVKNIVKRIEDNSGNGYIWHTTGSGKTLTSFKASTLLKDNPDIEKCLFVVDRKDLDRQTREEFNHFQEGCVEENTNTSSLVKRLLSDNYADKVIVTTIQKLGLALDENSSRNKSREKKGLETYKKILEPLSDKRLVFIFDECHRSQFGNNHDAIKSFFPKAQLFGFTGTPIFDENATYKQIDGTEASYKTTDTVFTERLHAYTIGNAIDDKNVLRFHIDHYKLETKNDIKPPEDKRKQAVINDILDKHDISTAARKFNAVFATSKIDDAIDYCALIKSEQATRKANNSDYKPLNIACVFSPPAEGNADVKQLQEDLPQELQDNKENPERKKQALKTIIADYNMQYGTNHSISDFDSYYQDVQKRIKDHKYPNQDYPHSQKIDIVIVVDMLLTGFDSKFLNTLYVDKNLKYHGLIQAFSRTNRVLNDTKPYGNIIDYREQQDKVKEAIICFSNKERDGKNSEIWLVDPAPKVVEDLRAHVQKLDDFMESQGLENRPENVANLKGDANRSQFINLFKEIQRCKTQLDQYTDLAEEHKQDIETIIPKETLNGFKGVYLSVAERLREKRDSQGHEAAPELQELDFEYVLFASEVIDYDYIMKLIAEYSSTAPSKQKMTREELIGLILSDAKFISEKEDIRDYINSLEEGQGLSEEDIRKGYEQFKTKKQTSELIKIADTYGLQQKALQDFVDVILQRMIFDDEALTVLLEPLELGWKARTQKKLALMDDLIPLLTKRAGGRDISGLEAYE